jgi:hypothetical protein
MVAFSSVLYLSRECSFFWRTFLITGSKSFRTASQPPNAEPRCKPMLLFEDVENCVQTF